MSFQGKRNVYLCDGCGRGHVTLDVDEGVTPFMMGCLHCGGMAQSLFYKVPQDWLARIKPAIEWYRPDSMAALTRAQAEHVEHGGLLSREVAP